jgi:hypothetical protein
MINFVAFIGVQKMSLEILAYPRIVPVDDPNAERLYINPAFPAQADDLKTGYYEGTPARCYHASYRAYNDWREKLCVTVLGVVPQYVWEHPQPGPFVELINFADNEGLIGPKTCAKLHADFLKYRDAVKHLGEDFLKDYDDIAEAFEIGSSGAVSFR